MKHTVKSDIVIVGAGAAGLFTALTLSPRPVTVLSEKPLGGISSSTFAQGGLAAAVDAKDNPHNHARDTMKAAAGIADAAVVDALTSEAPNYVRLLDKYGVAFERDEAGNFTLSREACHSHRRVLKAAEGDGFGKELMRALAEAVKNTPSINFIEGVSAERLVKNRSGNAAGVLARRNADNEIIFFEAPAVVLATGGIGGLFAATTNPLGAIGKGVAMAARAGVTLSDLEFVQFHPTALDIGEDPAPLATEVLRGEGAYLVNSRGERFMAEIHEMAELAPRDIVSRGIFAEREAGRTAYLDCRHIDVEKFPALLTAAARKNIDPRHQLVPVMPAVHYHMGGIATDLNGRTSLKGLWAAGEVAATGLHGANRLASNSLMEAVIMGGRVARDILATPLESEKALLEDEYLPRAPEHATNKVIHQIRQTMSDLVGVIRDRKGLETALRILTDIEKTYEGVDTKTADMALLARLIATAALERRESRGGHFRRDFPESHVEWQHRSFVTPIVKTDLKRKEKVA